jgi:hypothetical protein
VPGTGGSFAGSYSRSVRRLVGIAVLVAALAACGQTPAATDPTESTTTPTTSVPPTPTPTPTDTSSTARPEPGTVAPAWLGTRPLRLTSAGFGVQQPTPRALRDRRFTLPDQVPALPGRGFDYEIADPAPPAVLARSTWAPGCPVRANQLAWVRLTFWGFDHARHTGELLVNGSVADDVVQAFRGLYAARFPIEQMTITTKAEQTAHPTGDGNDTGAFNCRPVRGGTSYSQHAYGLAVDVNPFQNPYLNDDLVLPELAGAYRDRSWQRPGMIAPGSAVVRAFARIGWGWGGSWTSLKDLQHFSQNGR